MKNLNLNLDKTLASNSNIVISSQRALKSYIDDRRILLDFLQDTEPTTYSTDQKWLNTSNFTLYTAISSSTWDSGISITTGQIFSFDNLLYYYDGNNLLVYSTKSIIDLNGGAETKIWLGTQEEYDNLDNYDPDTIYNIVDNAQTISTLLATAQEYASGAQNKAATAYQVQQSLTNYLLLSGGSFDAGAILRFTNTNSGTNSISYDNSNVLNISNNVAVGTNLTVGSQLTANSIIATSGNIYKTNTSGETVVWSSTLNSYLPLAGGTMTGVLKITGIQDTSSNNIISYALGNTILGRYNIPSYLQGNTTGAYVRYGANGDSLILTENKKGVANGVASLDANAKIPSSQIPYATSSTVGGVKINFDSNTGTLNIIVE